MRANIVILRPSDNVGVALRDIDMGQSAFATGNIEVLAAENIGVRGASVLEEPASPPPASSTLLLSVRSGTALSLFFSSSSAIFASTTIVMISLYLRSSSIRSASPNGRVPKSWRVGTQVSGASGIGRSLGAGTSAGFFSPASVFSSGPDPGLSSSIGNLRFEEGGMPPTDRLRGSVVSQTVGSVTRRKASVSARSEISKIGVNIKYPKWNANIKYGS